MLDDTWVATIAASELSLSYRLSSHGYCHLLTFYRRVSSHRVCLSLHSYCHLDIGARRDL